MKYLKKIILIAILFVPLTIKAYVNYDITDYLIDAEIGENGDINISELIVLDGSFHGYIRDIVYKNSKLKENSFDFSNNAIYNAKGLTEPTIYAKKIDNEVTFNTFNEIFRPLEKVYYENDAENGNYLETSIQDGKSYKMYYEGNDEEVAYLLKYTIKSAVVMHNDVAEMYYTFIGDGFEDPINNLQIKVHLPGTDNSDLYRIWAHGDITGNINKLDNSTLLATMKSLGSNSPVDIRLTFDKNLIKDSTNLNKTNVEALNEILEVETKRAEKANEQRRIAKIIYNACKTFAIIFTLALISWWIYIYIKFDKEYKSTFTNEYNREFIDDYNVEIVDYLMKKNVSSNAMSASILNLVYKKNISVEEIETSKKKKEYKFTLLNRNNITDTEDLLLDFLFDIIGDGKTFTTKELDKYAKGSTTYNTFQSKYHSWLHCVKKEAEKQEFYEKNGVPIVSTILILLVAIFYTFIISYYQVDFLLSYLILPLSIVFLIYSISIKKRTIKGNEHFVRWKAFKKFLNDFGTFDTKELPEITLWERYLVYATLFGLADKVTKAMNTKIKEYPDYYSSYNYYPTWVNYNFANNINHAVASSINHAASAAVANSSSSSGSGFGGGFSSGGGFGGGGGGGHGF